MVKIELKAVVDGEIIQVEEIKDPVFSSKMIGDGYGVIPTGRKIYSPISGKVEEIAATKHAIYLSAEEGFKILIHLGIDTIKLKGEGFKTKIEPGMFVDEGDLLIDYDSDFVKEAGLDPVVSVIILTENEIDLTVFTTPSAKANQSIALKAEIIAKKLNE